MSYNTDGRKRPVILTLNKDLVSQAKSMTDNLSGVVESLLAEFVARERRDRQARSRDVETSVTLWNKFNDQMGSFADEYSSL
ncbi:MAG TPA: type II toxin-antitoxin system CcdA family antitoxin [Steroidobacteraceae bacterium]